MSFDKECAITMMVVATICLLCCGIMLHRNYAHQEIIKDLEGQVRTLQHLHEQLGYYGEKE